MGQHRFGTDREKYKDVLLTKWSQLLDFRWKNKLLMVDDMRDAFAVGLKANGFSINTKDEDEISLAYNYLERLSNNIKLYSGNPREEFVSQKVDVGMMWNGEVVVAQRDLPGMEYIYPEEGVSFWADNFAIPSFAKNVTNAHKFIDYMLRPDVAALTTKELGYATANMMGKELLEEDVRNNAVIFPPLDVINISEFQEDVGDAHEIYEIYWAKLKTIKGSFDDDDQ